MNNNFNFLNIELKFQFLYFQILKYTCFVNYTLFKKLMFFQDSKNNKSKFQLLNFKKYLFICLFMKNERI